MLTLSCPFSSKSRFLEFRPLGHLGVSLPLQLSFWFARSAFPKYLRIPQHGIGDLRKIVAELLVGDVIAGDGNKHRRSMTDKKQTVEYKRVVFWMPPKPVHHLGKKPCAKWPRALETPVLSANENVRSITGWRRLPLSFLRSRGRRNHPRAQEPRELQPKDRDPAGALG